VSNIDVQDKTVDAGHLAVKRGGPAIGLVLGSGAARGFAHIGVMRALQAHGIAPDIIVGTSMGALVGGCYATNQLDSLEDWARSLTRRRIISYLDVRIGGGVSVIRQYLIAGHIDAMHLALSPVFLGEGEALFAGIDLPALGLHLLSSITGENATHLLLGKR